MTDQRTSARPDLEPPPTQDGPAGTGETADGRSLGDLVGDIAQDLTTLVKQEVELAKAELKSEATRIGKGAGFVGAAGLAGYLAVLFLSLTAMFLLDNWMPLTVAALIVTAVWAVAAAVMTATGRKELRSAKNPLETTQQTLKEDAAWAKQLKNG